MNPASHGSDQSVGNPFPHYTPQAEPPGPTPYTQKEPGLTHQGYSETLEYDPYNKKPQTHESHPNYTEPHSYNYYEQDPALLYSYTANPDYTNNDQVEKPDHYSTLTPEQNENIKTRLSTMPCLSSFNYRLLKLSELIKAQAKIKQFRKISIENFVVVSDVDTAVETTSNGWIKLEVMKKFGFYNKDFVECIKLLDSKYHISGWKKSRGDGNCYYRAVITRYYDIIFGVYSLTSNINFFIAILDKLKDFSENSFNFGEDYQNALSHVIFYTDELKRQKESDPYNTYHYLNSLFQNRDVDLNLVKVSRMLTYMGLINRAAEYAEFGMNITENYAAMILTMGEEAQEFVLMLLPLELCIQVVQYNLFNKVLIETFPDQSEKTIKIHIVRRGGHYDILYTKQECEQDMFDFCSGSYHFLQSS